MRNVDSRESSGRMPTQRRSNNLLTSRDRLGRPAGRTSRPTDRQFAICYTADRQRCPVQRQEIRPEAKSQRDKQAKAARQPGPKKKRKGGNLCCKFLLSFIGNAKIRERNKSAHLSFLFFSFLFFYWKVLPMPSTLPGNETEFSPTFPANISIIGG